MGQIIFLTNMERQYAMLEQARDSLVRESRMPVNGQAVFLHDDIFWDRQWQEIFAESAVVVFSWMGMSEDTEFLKEGSAFLRARHVPHLMLASDPYPEENCQGATRQDQDTVSRYLMYGGLENYRYFWLWLSSRFCGAICEVQPPQPLVWNGIFHPRADGPVTDSGEYRRCFCQPGRATVGIIFYRDEWLWSDLAYQTALVEEIERHGMNALAVFTMGMPDAEFDIPGVDETVRTYFMQDGRPVIDVLINTIKFSLTTSTAVDQKFLEKLGVPVLHAYALIRGAGEWEQCMDGMTALEMSVNVTLPEFDGVIHSVPVAGKEYLADGNVRHHAIHERINMVVRKAGKWAALRRKSNNDKKVAIIFHNYPATNSNIGSAAGLDSPESIRILLQEMTGRGYRVDELPADSQTLINSLIAQVTNDRRFLSEDQIKRAAGKLSEELYQQCFSQWDVQTREQLIRDWGPAPGEVFHYDQFLLVPGLLNGNIFITVQPPRGFGEDPSKIYHSPDCSPTHHYLAYYHWVRDIWQADAVIHVGTHGSLEWLPGKAAGLSRRCYPDLALGDLPNIYPYWITVVGEGVQAKRRGAACLISYLTPPMSHAGTYDELAELEKLLDEYCHFKQSQPGNVEAVMTLIREKAAQANLQEDVPEAEQASFDEYVGRLHAYITDIKHMQIRVGLHVLGSAPQDENLIEYLLALTRMDNGEVPSLAQTMAAVFGYDYYDLLENSAAMLPDGSRTLGMLLDEIRQRSREVVLCLAEQGFCVDEAAGVLELPWAQGIKAPLSERLAESARYICSTLVPNLEKTCQEISNLLDAMEGHYVEPGPGGAPTSGMADILPTGRNFYGVDPRNLPTPAAWEIGKTMGDSIIARYLDEEGCYPESVGIVLWSTSNMRSHGQCIAEFLYLLGVRPVRQRGMDRVIDVEVIPMKELQRPRIDVTARISGFFRDSMPGAVAWLDKAVDLVVNLDEGPEINYVRKHVFADMQDMLKQGMEQDKAWELSCYRIFGDPPGTYGAGVGAVLEEKNWETLDDLARVYVRWGGHAYGSRGKGVYVPEVFSRRMKSLDVTIQNEDNREVSMLSSDDYNAYHGGMIASVRSLKGRAPRSYCGDSSDRSKVVMRSVSEEVKRLFRGETMNPKFIEGMKQHGYKGAADLASYVAHCYEWDATSAVMEDWMYEGLAQKYALDDEMRQWMQEVNPWALQRIAEKLLEAAQRGLWQAGEQTKQELQELYLSIEGELEELGDGR